MINIPFLEGFLGKKVKKNTVADFVDHLNYYVTSYLLGFFAVALAGKQYFGSPIQCWAPSEFKEGWGKYAEDYCFIANSYHVPFDQFHLPKHGDPARGDHYSYYRWVPIMLAIQSMCFFLPNYLWSLMHRQTAINPAAFIEEAEKVSKLFGDKKQEEMGTLASAILQTLSEFRACSFVRGRQAALLYLLTKALYVLNIYLQYLILTAFLGENYIHWGYNMAYKLYHGIEEDDSLVFPRVIMCDFKIRTIANPHPYTVQCVLMMNYINEKLYFILYFWFIFLGIFNSLSCLYQLLLVIVPCLRSIGIRKTLKGKQDSKEVSKFFSTVLQSDGVLLLRFISSDLGSLFSSQLADALFREHNSKDVSSISRNSSVSSLKTCSTQYDVVEVEEVNEEPDT